MVYRALLVSIASLRAHSTGCGCVCIPCKCVYKLHHKAAIERVGACQYTCGTE